MRLVTYMLVVLALITGASANTWCEAGEYPFTNELQDASWTQTITTADNMIYYEESDWAVTCTDTVEGARIIEMRYWDGEYTVQNGRVYLPERTCSDITSNATIGWCPGTPQSVPEFSTAAILLIITASALFYTHNTHQGKRRG